MRRRAAARNSSEQSRAPANPCTGSTSTAATSSSTAASSAATSSKGTFRLSGHAGAARRLLVARPVGAGERRGRAPVPAAPHRDDRLPPGVPPGQMQRVLVGLRARVAEEDPPERLRTELGQLLGQRLPLRQRHGRRVEQELRRLLGDGAHDVGMAVPGRGDRVAAIGIEPLVRRPRPPARSRGPGPGADGHRRSVHRQAARG